jgi:hypothetical protein
MRFRGFGPQSIIGDSGQRVLTSTSFLTLASLALLLAAGCHAPSKSSTQRNQEPAVTDPDAGTVCVLYGEGSLVRRLVLIVGGDGRVFLQRERLEMKADPGADESSPYPHVRKVIERFDSGLPSPDAARRAGNWKWDEGTRHKGFAPGSSRHLRRSYRVKHDASTGEDQLDPINNQELGRVLAAAGDVLKATAADGNRVADIPAWVANVAGAPAALKSLMRMPLNQSEKYLYFETKYAYEETLGRLDSDGARYIDDQETDNLNHTDEVSELKYSKMLNIPFKSLISPKPNPGRTVQDHTGCLAILGLSVHDTNADELVYDYSVMFQQDPAWTAVVGFPAVDAALHHLGLIPQAGMTLRILDVSHSDLTDDGIRSIKQSQDATFSQIITLYCNNTIITDNSIDTIKDLGRLRFANLKGTRVTAAGIGKLRAALPEATIVADFGP